MSFFLNDVKFVYIIIVGICGPILIWLLMHWINIVERKKRNRIKSLKRFEAIKTTTPLNEPLVDAKEAALGTVDLNFSIIKKSFIVLIIIIWAVFLIFPFLNQIPATLISVFIGTLGVIIGVAARPFIENMISGVVLSLSKSIRIGDTVIIDKSYGTVEDLTISHTIIKLWNWRRYLIPNSTMLTKDFTNCTLSDNYQWAHVEFLISYDSNIKTIEEIAIESAKSSRYFAGHEQPKFWVYETNKESVMCWIAAWANSPAAAWQLKHEIRTNLIKKFQEFDIKPHKIILDRELSEKTL
ncbi:MAG: mechanosensitive ion channel family protein [Victivallales bacterium]|nr:mechanosensitive ion channel family protein [Victivallales bacterium]